MSDKHYVVATIRPWNIAQFHAATSTLPGVWHLITDRDELSIDRVAAMNPRYIFLPHWSHRVPAALTAHYECVCFHETNLPYGRGGSPLQNLIARAQKETVIAAFQMVEDLDAGPIYAKRSLSLLGLAEEIYLRATEIVFDMIREIVMNEPLPVAQSGAVTIFERRTPDQSAIPLALPTLDALFDHIRMLDADEYPHAFLDYGNFRLEITRPALRTGRIAADVTITLIPKPGKAP